MISELITNALHSTPQGFVGVGIICIYFVVMLWAIRMRVIKAEHLDH